MEYEFSHIITKPSTDVLDYFVNLPLTHKATGYPEGAALTYKQLYTLHTRNMAFSCPYGAMVFEYVGDDVFNSHFYFVQGSPGREIKSHALRMLQIMFTTFGASAIVGYPPRDNRAVRVIGNALGYRKVKSETITDALGRVCDTYKVIPKWVLQLH